MDDPPFDFQKNPNLRISTISIESEVDLPKFGEERNLAKQLRAMDGNGFKKQFPHLPPPYVSMRGEFESDFQRGNCFLLLKIENSFTLILSSKKGSSFGALFKKKIVFLGVRNFEKMAKIRCF